MKKIQPGDSESMSQDIIAQNILQLRSLFPEAWIEGKLDFDVLKQLLGGVVDEWEEKYGLNWHGKRRARQLALTPSLGTLRPCQEESVDWDTTQNIIIEGDNLEVLKLLQKSYAGKVKVITIDPPYNTGNDFVYPDDFQDNVKNYLTITGQTEAGVGRLTSNAESSGRYHTSWLSMMLPRLILARNLLRSDGAIFVTIDDNELHNLRSMLNEVFGEENFVAQVEWQKRYTRSNNTDDFTSVIDHVCIYQKSDHFQVNLLERDEAANARFTNPDNDPRGEWKATPFLNQVSPDRRPNLCYPIRNPKTGQVTNPDKKAWRYEKSVFERLQEENRLYWGKDGDRPVPDIKTFLSEVRSGMTPINFWSHQYAGNTDQANKEIKDLFGEKVFDTPKPLLLIQRMLEHASTGDDLVLDFFAGSGTSGHAVLLQNATDGRKRRYILVQLPEPLSTNEPTQKLAADLCKSLNKRQTLATVTAERLRRAGKKVKEDFPLFSGDVGFRLLKLDSSNIHAWNPDPENLEADLISSVDHIRPDRGELDVLFELLQKLGVDLATPIETREIVGKRMYSVGAGTVIACLSEKIDSNEIEPIASGLIQWKEQLLPAGEVAVIFRDSSFENDVSKTNLTAILSQHSFSNVRCL